MSKHKEAEKDYKKGMKYKELAEKYEVSINTIKSWKQRYKWVRTKKSVCKHEKGASKTKGEKVKVAEKESEIESAELTEKQRLFAEVYVRNFNATQAAIKAGYSPESAYVIGHENLRKPKIKRYINYLKGLKKESILLSEDDIVERYMRIAFADITDFVDFGHEQFPVLSKEGFIETLTNPVTGVKEPVMQKVNTVKFKDSNQVDGGLVSEIKTSKQGASIKLEDRQKALDWLSKYFEMNPEHKHRKEHDEKKLQLERDRFEFTKKQEEKNNW